MFKVHLPAKSYLRKQIPFTLFGTNEMVAMLSPMIRKAALLEYTDRDLNHLPHTGWPSDEHISGDPDVPDAPPWNRHPETGEYLPGSKHDGMHTIDFIHHDLQTRLGFTPKKAKEVIDKSIALYNAKHPDGSNHTLPSFDSNQWRKVFVGPTVNYQDPTHLRLVRGKEPLYEGGPRPLITYGYNTGNVDHPMASTGKFMEAGYHHMNTELGETLLAEGVDPNLVKELDYVSYNRLLPRDLSGGLVQSWKAKELDQYTETGLHPKHLRSGDMHEAVASQQAHPEINAHQIPHLLSDHWFHPQLKRDGTATSGSKASLSKLAEMLEQNGISAEGFDEEEMRKIASTRAFRMLLGEKGQKFSSEGSGGAVKSLANAMFNHMGSSHDDEKLSDYKSHAAAGMRQFTMAGEVRNTANHRAAEIMGHVYNGIDNAMQTQGMDEETAKQYVLERMRNAELDGVGARGFQHVEGIRDKAESLLTTLLGHTGHEQMEIGGLPQERVSTPAPVSAHHDFPTEGDGSDIHRRVLLPGDLAPVGSDTREVAPAPAPAPAPAVPEDPFTHARWGPPAPAPAPAAPAPMPTPQVVPVPQMRQATPIEQAWQQMRGQPPQQTFFDIGTGGLVQRSHDVTSSLDEIRKKMGYFDGFLRGYQSE